MMDCRLRGENSTRMKKLTSTGSSNPWKEEIQQLKTQMKITEEDLKGKKQSTKACIKKKSELYFKNKLVSDSTNKSKMDFLIGNRQNWKPGTRAKYLSELTRHEASLIFKTRTRMIDVKNNFRSKYSNTTCRARGKNQRYRTIS